MSTYAAGTPLPLRARRLRKERHWTQQDVADRAGVSLRTYQLFENEQSKPQPANLRAITEALGLEGGGEVTESRWEPDIRAFLNTLGIYMEGLSDKERERFILTETRRIFREMRTANARVDTMADQIAAAMGEAPADETQGRKGGVG